MYTGSTGTFCCALLVTSNSLLLCIPIMRLHVLTVFDESWPVFLYAAIIRQIWRWKQIRKSIERDDVVIVAIRRIFVIILSQGNKTAIKAKNNVRSSLVSHQWIDQPHTHIFHFSDALYRLSFTLSPYEKQWWEASEAIVDICKQKGANDEDCHNYVMVLQSYGNQLYACGTHAFSPQCSWRQVYALRARIHSISHLFCAHYAQTSRLRSPIKHQIMHSFHSFHQQQKKNLPKTDGQLEHHQIR